MSPDSISRDGSIADGAGQRVLAALGTLARLSRQERDDLAAKCVWRWFERGEAILRHQDTSREVHFVVCGQLRIAVDTTCGKEVTFDDRGPGAMVGELAAIDGRPRSATITALERTLIASLPPESFAELLHRSPAFCDAVLTHLAGIVRTLNNRVVEHASLRVNHRIRRELLRLARDGNHALAAAGLRRFTHAELASRVGTHREAVTREINRLVAMKLVSRQGRGLVIEDPAALELMMQDVRDQR